MERILLHSSQEQPALPTPSSPTSSLQSWRQYIFTISATMCGISLQQRWQTRSGAIPPLPKLQDFQITKKTSQLLVTHLQSLVRMEGSFFTVSLIGSNSTLQTHF